MESWSIFQGQGRKTYQDFYLFFFLTMSCALHRVFGNYEVTLKQILVVLQPLYCGLRHLGNVGICILCVFPKKLSLSPMTCSACLESFRIQLFPLTAFVKHWTQEMLKNQSL